MSARERKHAVHIDASEVSMEKLMSMGTGIAVILSLAVCAGVLYLTFGPSKIRFKVGSRPSTPSKSPDRSVSTLPGDFAYHTLDGEEQHLLASKGKVLFVNRWGTWCAPCVSEMPSIQKLYDRYKSDPEVKFLIIASLDSASNVRTFALHHHLDMPFYIDEDADTTGIDVSTFPSTSIYGKDGNLVSKQLGSADWSAPAVIEQIEKLKRQTEQHTQ
jgi:thiol-disulfide isomerase/thioredoxin